MRKYDTVKKDITRYKTKPEEGLSDVQIKERISQNLTNHTKQAVGKSYWEIIRTDVLSFFNILLFAIAALMIIAQYYRGLLFLVVIIPNMIIGLYEDLKAKYLLKKLHLLTQPRATVIRNKVEQVIQIEDVVLDDILVLKNEMQISADGTILSGSILVNESLLTGEPDNIEKKPGDKIYSGSFVVSGKAYARAEVIGGETFANRIQNKANKFSRSPSVILLSLRKLFRFLGIMVIILGSLSIIMYATKGQLSTYEDFKVAVPKFAGSMIGMIPSGLYLLTSAALAVTVISLGKRGAQVQDFYSVEMLARSDILCVDKTGTITDGSMVVKEFEVFDKKKKEQYSMQISTLLAKTSDSNLTSIALRNYFKDEPRIGVTKVLPFNSDNKYSAVTFEDGRTYIIGAIDFINFTDKPMMQKLAKNYTSNGLRVLGFGRVTKGEINHGLVIGDVEPLGVIVLQDHIREDAIKTFKWFAQNKVGIRVISGDDPQTVSYIAKQAGIANADKFVSLQGVEIEEVKKLAKEFTVFGRVTPEQKEAIVQSLKEDGHTVAMTGDGVNDILALKRSDCSIAMATGADAARNVSHIVLLDSNFDHLPSVVAEGRRVVNNIQRTSSLYLAKTSFAAIFTIIFLVSGFMNFASYPFNPNHLYLWEFISIGIASFFIALEPNSERVEGKFFHNIFKKLIPGALLMILPVLTMLIISVIPGMNHSPFYIPNLAENKDTFVTMAVISMSLCSLVFLFKLSCPLSKYRGIVVVCSTLVVGGLIALSIFVPFVENFFGLNYKSLTSGNIMLLVSIVVGYVVLYFVGTRLYELIKGERTDD